ncbi:MAG: PLDc N-terminal domain-containing protein [Candidatus Nanoarchaeia archaeon]|nr:PLDc N-terminal domain-containing protein [Candidatus Nanoarchaeia archaeon]MDD5357876.1 PLDc N-terminal domain-containing protein [Candidatus Nanoarchaeia archaeon]MDD5588795.1 PLDc N-terminal domain-containing protein [Candidatus Nanoarchaeia archaeon]
MVDIASLLGGTIFFWIILSLITGGLFIFFFVFWILMLVDCIQKKFKEDVEKIVWILVLIFTGVLGALIYYFVVKKKSKKRK